MNDDFLQRLRKAPPPEFLAGLKARLDRQPFSPAPAPQRRFTFSRGLLVGFLLGGAAFAITAASVPKVSDALRDIVRVPVQFVVQILSGGSRAQDGTQHKAIPLGPVWLPERPGRSTAPAVPTAPASLDAQAGNDSRARGAAGGTATAGTGRRMPDDMVVLATRSVLARATVIAAAAHTGCCVGRIDVQLETDRKALERLCSGPDTAGAPAVIELSRRLTPEETRTCSRTAKLIEVKVGYEAVVLARAKLYGALRPTARGLFRALAKRIPDPSRPGTLIDNPNATWSQVDLGMPYERDRIQVIGPAPDSAPGKLAARLLLEAGCNSYDWIAALRDEDPDRYEEICTTLRDDGVYKPSGASGWAYADELAANPTVLGVFSPGDFQSAQDRLSASLIEGIEPSRTSVVDGSYPASRALYLYANKRRVGLNWNFGNLVRSNMARGNDPTDWGFVFLDSAESAAALASIKEMLLY